MKVDLYNAIVSAQMSRRKMLKGSASLGAVAAMGGLGGAASAAAHGGVRAEIMKIPGVGMGSPGDPEWQKVVEDSHKDGIIVKNVENQLLNPTDYSPLK